MLTLWKMQRRFGTDPEGERYLKIVEASDGNRHDHYIKEGDGPIYNLLFTSTIPFKGPLILK